MKKSFILLVCLVSVHFLLTSAVFADPRMETNNNFCHFILDPDNTDNEIFLAGCDSVITVVEKSTSAPAITVNCEGSNRVASGYAVADKVLPLVASPAPPGTVLRFNSDGSDTPCTMVESNGRQYTSNKWQSRVRVDASRKGFVQVHYELFCEGGVQ